MRAVNAADKSDDRARRLLDYRNYHRYEIEIVPADRYPRLADHSAAAESMPAFIAAPYGDSTFRLT